MAFQCTVYFSFVSLFHEIRDALTAILSVMCVTTVQNNKYGQKGLFCKNIYTFIAYLFL